MTITAKLFMSGRSQAIRLPVKLRLAAKEVRIEQVGNALWVQAEPAPDQNMVERFAGLCRGQLWLSAIVAAELRFGA